VELGSLVRHPDVDLSEANVRGLASTEALQARAITCFNEEAK